MSANAPPPPAPAAAPIKTSPPGTSTLKPFQAGDIFAGCTVLNRPEDDHSGDGRIIQFDRNLNEKGVLWTQGTTHLIGGLAFAPDRTLWAFDSNSFTVLRVGPDGKQLPNIRFADRAFSNINFAADGTVYLGEHLVGNTVRMRPGTTLGTTLPKLPGQDRFGDGHLFQFTTGGKLLKEFPTPTHGGMPGFLGLTGSALRPDGRTMLYLSELSDSIRVWDLVNNKALPNLITYAPDSGNMAMTVQYTADNKLLHIRANFKAGFFLEHLSETGEVLREYPLPGPGWAAVGRSTEPDMTLIGNFTGQVAKFDLKSGQIAAKAETGVQRSLAGLAQF